MLRVNIFYLLVQPNRNSIKRALSIYKIAWYLLNSFNIHNNLGSLHRLYLITVCLRFSLNNATAEALLINCS